MICNIKGKQQDEDSMFELGFSMNADEAAAYPGRHSEFPGLDREPLDLVGESDS